MTPNEIEILIRCHVSPTPPPRGGYYPVVDSVLNSLVMLRLIKKDDKGIYSTTDRGAAHIMQICKLPLPDHEWIGADGKVIKQE